MKVLIVDNYDSFTYNLHHYVENCGVESVVKRNDDIHLDEIDLYDKIILSPGPGLPSETVLMFELLEKYAGKKPILGVCLGMQGIAEFYGATLFNQEKVKHGVQVNVKVDTVSVLFQGLPENCKVGLYHSWCVDKNTLPSFFHCTGVSDEGVLMAFENKEKLIFAVQFHPESVMTGEGMSIIKNFVLF